MRVDEPIEHTEETVRRWYCDHCGKRYDTPGICTDGHQEQPVELQEVHDPVNPEPVEPVVQEPTAEEQAIALAEQGKDAVIANQAATITQLQNQVQQQQGYIAELEAKVNPDTTKQE